MTSHTDLDQIYLSEDLSYLRKFWTSENRIRYPFANEQELVLNAVALYMTTGRPDGAIATFFHETTFTLYLAKNGPLGDGDTDMATSFFACLKDAVGFKTLLPFLSRYSATNVEKRVRYLCETFEMIFPDMSRVALEPQENRALESLKSLLESPFTLNNTTESHNNFKNIITASKDLLEVFSFWCALASKYGNVYLSRLERNLSKVVQYLDVKHLIRFVQRHDSKITVLWVPDMDPIQISLNTGTGFIDRHLDTFLAWAVIDIDADEKAKLRELMVLTLEDDEPDFELTLLVHPEIRLIMYLTDIVGVQSQYPPGAELYIGSGKRVCCCCDRWIDAFNNCLTVKWTTTYVNNQMRYDWRIPDPDLTQHIQDAVRQGNDAVLKGVKRGLEDGLFHNLDYSMDQMLDRGDHLLKYC